MQPDLYLAWCTITNRQLQQLQLAVCRKQAVEI